MTQKTFQKKKYTHMAKRFFALTALLSFFLFDTHLATAAAITTPRNYLNRQKAAETTGIQHEIFFTEASGKTSTDNEVRIIFPDADDGLWCRSAGSLTLTAITNPTGATESATGLLGSLSGTCAQGSGSGAAESNSDRLLITGVGALSASTKYGVRAVGNVAALGTAAAANNIKVEVRTYEDSGTLEDTGTLALSLIADDQVSVTATVDATLSVALSGTTASLGTLSTSNVNQASITSTISTNASGGFVSLVKYGATLTSGANTIPDESGGGTIVAGTSEYGASSDDTTSVDLATTSNSCATGGGPMNATALSTTFKIFASESAAASADVTTLCFVATTSATQQPGSYTSTATLVTTARF